MPALFDVPGWSVPSDPVSTQRHSKKRRRAAGSEEQDLLRAAQANLDKLIDSFGEDDAGSSKKKTKTKPNKSASQPSRRDKPPSHKQTLAPTSDSTKAKRVKKKNAAHAAQSTNESERPPAAHKTVGLTSLQQSLRKSLDGAHFRSVPISVGIYYIDLSSDKGC